MFFRGAMEDSRHAESSAHRGLKKQAEEILTTRPRKRRTAATPDFKRLIHEMNVHQVELALQNKELIEAQQLTAESQRKYADLFEYAPVGYFLTDANGLISMVNLEFAGLIGRPREHFTNLSPSHFIFEKDEPVYYSHRRSVINSKTCGRCQLRLRKSDGTTCWVILSSHPMQDAQGNVIKILSAAMDIQGRRQAEDRLQRATLELEIKNRISEIFLTGDSDSLYTDVLNVVLDITRSEYGTFAYIDENGDRVVPTMTRNIWDACEVTDKKKVFPRETWGESLWARCVGEKKTMVSEGPFNLPDGHIPLVRAVAAPIIFRKAVIGTFTVANKPAPYDEKDLTLLEEIADFTAPILHARLLNDIYMKNLVEAREDVRRLTREIINAGEVERRRISWVLHDELAQDLSSIKLRMAGLLQADGGAPRPVAQDVRNLLGLVQGTIDKVRNLSHSLHPSTLEEFGVVDALKGYIEEMTEKDPACRIRFIHEDMKGVRLDYLTEIMIYRLAVEGLRNIRKHARADRAEIEVACRPPDIFLTISDNGKGFAVDAAGEAARKTKSLGLKIMQERTAHVHGDIRIESAPGRGTKIHIKIPIWESRHGEKADPAPGR